MAGALRTITRRFVLFLTLVCCVVYLAACLVPYISAEQWWFIGFLGLAFPYIATFLLFFVIFWLIVKPAYAFIPFVILCIGYQQLSVLFALHFNNSFTVEKCDSCLRIVDWNVGNMYGRSSQNEIREHNRVEIAGAVLNMKPDIICLQEFNHSVTQGEQANNISLFSGEYPYSYFSKDLNRKNGYYQYGSIIFSKYPIVDSGIIRYPHYSYESLIYADVKVNKDTIRVYTSHLQSFRFSGEDYQGMSRVAEQDEEAVQASKNIFVKMKSAFIRRSVQADVVNREIRAAPYSSIMCGDFNDVPNSYTYFKIRGLRQDAFLQKDFGIGKSYNALAPTLRIDYILPDTTFTVKQFEMVDEDLSDHSMLVSDVSLRRKSP